MGGHEGEGAAREPCGQSRVEGADQRGPGAHICFEFEVSLALNVREVGASWKTHPGGVWGARLSGREARRRLCSPPGAGAGALNQGNSRDGRAVVVDSGHILKVEGKALLTKRLGNA